MKKILFTAVFLYPVFAFSQGNSGLNNSQIFGIGAFLFLFIFIFLITRKPKEKKKTISVGNPLRIAGSEETQTEEVSEIPGHIVDDKEAPWYALRILNEKGNYHLSLTGQVEKGRVSMQCPFPIKLRNGSEQNFCSQDNVFFRAKMKKIVGQSTGDCVFVHADSGSFTILNEVESRKIGLHFTPDTVQPRLLRKETVNLKIYLNQSSGHFKKKVS